MRRRAFLKLTIGAATYQPASFAARPHAPEQIMTVLGPLAPRSLGRTLMHEHILVDFIGADQITAGRYDPEAVFDKALPNLQKLKTVGCDTIVDCTPNFLGRDPELLRRLSKAAGLRIITNTGLYGAANDKYVPHFAYQETAEQLAALWVEEFVHGIPPSGIRPGIIKIGVDPGPLSEIDAKLVEAAARTHRQTGLTIASHTGNGIAAMAQLARLKEQGIGASAFIWVHAQNESDTRLHLAAAEAGAWVEFDGVAHATAEKHVNLVLRMKEAGHLGRVLISQDAGWYHVGEPAGGNFRPYDPLFTEFLPLLRKAGLDERQIGTLLVRNPREALTLRKRTLPMN